MQPYALPDGGIERFVFGAGFVLPILSALFQPLAASLTALLLPFPAHDLSRRRA